MVQDIFPKWQNHQFTYPLSVHLQNRSITFPRFGNFTVFSFVGFSYVLQYSQWQMLSP